MAAQSFPSVHVTGAVHHYVRVATAGAPGGTPPNNGQGPGHGGQGPGVGTEDRNVYYLGTAEITPQMQRRRYTQKVMADQAGKTMPFQKTYDGEGATVSVLLSYFSRLAWEKMLIAGRTSGLNAGVSGEESRWSRGALVYGQLTFELWQVFDFALNPAGATPGLEIGWYWPQVQLLEHNTVKAGTQGEGLLCVFDCTPQYQPQASFSTVNDANNERGWLLYSCDPIDFPDAVLTPQ